MNDPIRFVIRDIDAVRYELQGAYDAPVGRGSQQSGFFDHCFASWYIRSGSVKISCGGREWRVGPGEWFLGDPIHRRSQVFERGSHIVSIRFFLHSSALFRLPGLPSSVDAERVPELLPVALALVEGMPRSHPQGVNSWQEEAVTLPGYFAHQQRFHAWMRAWFVAVTSLGFGPEAVHIRDGRVRRAVESLDELRGLASLPYEALEAATGLGRAQLDRLFRREMGQSMRRYVDHRCLHQAQALLQGGELSVKEVATRLGFVDSSHFGKWFRRQTGQAPLAWSRGGREV